MTLFEETVGDRQLSPQGTERLLDDGEQEGHPAALAPRIEIILDALDAATDIAQLNVPGFRLHQLKGDRKGEWSIWVNGNWRITFKFIGGYAHDVDLEDYH